MLYSAAMAVVAIAMVSISATPAIVSSFFIAHALLSFHHKVGSARAGGQGGQTEHCHNRPPRSGLRLVLLRHRLWINRGDRGTGKDDGIADDRHAGTVHLSSVIGGSRVAGDIADRLAAAVGADSGKPVSDLVVIGIIGIISLPLDVLEFQRPAPLCNGLGQMVGIGAGQVGIAAGGCDRSCHTRQVRS